jgi:peptidoglycan hydrolase-like protein with peptidoglycan-binding domain
MKLIIRENQLKKLINIIKEDNSDRKLNVLFVGDSLSSAPGYTWNYKLADKNSSEWNSDHLAVGGKMTQWMLENLKMKLNQKKYDLVFIYGGTNDMFSQITISSALNNIQEMVDLVDEQGGKTIVFSGYDTESVITDDKLKPTYYKGVILCDMPCMKRGRDRMIEFQSKLKGIRNATVIPVIEGNSSWTNDGTHPGINEHETMANYVDNYISGKIDIDKEDEKSWDFGSNFLSDLKSYVTSYLTSTFGSLFGVKTLTNQLIDDLKSLNKTNTLEIGDSSDDISKYQLALQLLDFPAPMNGQFDDETKKAVLSFQKKHNLDLTGKITTEVKDKIIKLVKDEVTDEDFNKIDFDKNKKKSFIDDFFSKLGGDSFSKVTASSSIVDKFKNVLKQNNLDYSNFVNELNNIGLNPNIAIKQLYAESGFRPDVISCKTKSSAGAEGIAQFIPTTWDYYGAGGSPCNVKDSLKAYVKLMKDLIKMFPNRIDLAVAGYNSGPYLSIYKKALNNDLSFDDIKYDIPSETRGYVEKILFSN